MAYSMWSRAAQFGQNTHIAILQLRIAPAKTEKVYFIIFLDLKKALKIWSVIIVSNGMFSPLIYTVHI